jgi:hypothetical protein
VEVKALSLSRKAVGLVVVGVPNHARLKGVLHPSNLNNLSNSREEDTKGVVEVGALKEVEEVMVGAVVVVERHHSNSMVGPLNIKAGEGEGRRSKVLVEGMVVVAVVAVA